MRVTEKRKAILKAHKLMRQGFLEAGATRLPATVGYPSGEDHATVWYISENEFWLAQIPETNRLFNCFGFDWPYGRSNLNIAVEANSPSTGIDRKIGGVYLEDAQGRLYIGHRGIIRGNHPIRKNTFLEMFSAELEQVKDGNRNSKVLVLAALDSPQLVPNLMAFTRIVSLAKYGDLSKNEVASLFSIGSTSNATSEESSTNEVDETFVPERTGVSRRKAIDESYVQWNHGVVVAALRKRFEKLAFKCSNDKHRDLVLTLKKEKTSALVEVKTSYGRTSVYTAIGQLAYHAKQADERVIVLPTGVTDTTRSRIKTLGIHLVTFHWTQGVPVFPTLEAEIAGFFQV